MRKESLRWSRFVARRTLRCMLVERAAGEIREKAAGISTSVDPRETDKTRSSRVRADSENRRAFRVRERFSYDPSDSVVGRAKQRLAFFFIYIFFLSDSVYAEIARRIRRRSRDRRRTREYGRFSGSFQLDYK